MTTLSPLEATNPDTSAIVAASAGTGKTWLLITRLLRLLLAGANPGGITAITFTNKAAGEMQERLRERAAALAMSSEANLDAALREMGLEPTAALRLDARNLYERLLTTPYPVRTQTFHKFCISLLQKFPLEADVPAGFELLDNEEETIEQAWQELLAITSNQAASESNVRASIEAIIELTGSPSSINTMVRAFIHSRLDWWAYSAQTEATGAALALWASQALRNALQLPEHIADPAQLYLDFFANDLLQAGVAKLLNLYEDHGSKSEKDKKAPVVRQCLDASLEAQTRFEYLSELFFTQNGDNRKTVVTQGALKALDEEARDTFDHWLDSIRDTMRRLQSQIKAETNWLLNHHWLVVGQAALDVFQLLKRQRRVLDFSDLEWQTWRLLNQSEHAHWIQYKLDQRIEHLLVDEFQDTNPTQWQLIRPMLEEFAAQLGNEDVKQHTAFIVGDTKQAIYGFRRADHRILGSASEWLQQSMQAQAVPLSTSYRSAELIMAFTNAVFQGTNTTPALLENFPEHATYRHSLWGRIELLKEHNPYTPTSNEEEPTYFRNPLLEATPLALRPLYEAEQIADRIDELMREGMTVGDPPRPLQYNDILILLRSRKIAPNIEQALLARGIPFEGADKGTLLDSQEVKDIMALMQLLCAPFDNVACAHVLRSPLFSASNDDLLFLAQQAGSRTWYETLQTRPNKVLTPSLLRAKQQLADWQTLVDRLPTHDMLDRIYNEGNVLARFRDAFPPHLASKATANLRRFLGLALELDSGRYPSMSQLLSALQRQQASSTDSPDAANVEDAAGEQVRIMTIHAAKGLEAPVVFLADTASNSLKSSSNLVLSDWDENKPRYFAYATKKSELCDTLLQWKQSKESAESLEELHLLYVALTRACQMLIISSSTPYKNGDRGWRYLMENALQFMPDVTDTEDDNDDQTVSLTQAASAPCKPVQVISTTEPTIVIDERLGVPVRERSFINSASQTTSEDQRVHDNSTADEEQLRGIAIHLVLEHGEQLTVTQLANMLQLPTSDERIKQWHVNAQQVLQHPNTQRLMSPPSHVQVKTEVEITYLNTLGKTQAGIIDRLLIDNVSNTLTIIDFKTHALAIDENPEIIANSHGTQLQQYADGLCNIYPNYQMELLIVFTTECLVVEIHREH